MIKMKKKHPNRTLFLMFLLCLSLIIGLFAYRVGTGICVTEMSAGEPTMLSREYTLGTIVDRNDEFIVSGDEKAGDVMWRSPETMTAFKDLLGLDFGETMESRTSILINAPWVFGAEDNRFSLYSLLHPQNKKIGGDARITIDRKLQEYISSYVLKKGYNTDDVYAVVSDYRTGELLAVYGKAFRTLLSPGSAIKPVIAASVLDLDPDKKNFTYDCTEENHVFQTEVGAFRIDCSEGVHGQMNMENAMAVSCNGYFISLLQSVDKKSLLEKMKGFGFDTEVIYPEFDYADQKFASGAASESDDYLMAAIGQASAKTTVLGMQLCTSALLNGGYLQSPYWISAKRATAQDKNWTDIEVNQEASRRVCSEETADFVVKAMEAVTEKGTGKNFNFPADSGYHFAAKTGTAQKGILSEETGEELYSVWTTGGLVSEDDSEAAPYAVTVCLDNVNDKEITSQQAGEMARDILLFLTEKCEQ